MDYVLGIDLGVGSLGWALISTDSNDKKSILQLGVRCWDAKTSDDPQNIIRRQSRSRRRQNFRRAQRLRRTFRILQEMDLFPTGPWSSTARKAFLETLDQKAQEWLRTNVPDANDDGLLAHTFIYRLRAAALDHPLPPELLGRVFFHLAQRRGFLSNRKAQPKDDKEPGVVKQGISQLQDEIQKSGARTLGEFFSRLNPHEQRIRNRYTSRKMFQDEFEKIWNAQQLHHPNALTDSNKKRLYEAIFFQRPLKIPRSFVGRCSLEILTRKLANGQIEYIYPFRRAPMASLEAQRIRYMERINNLEIITPDGECRPLTPEKRKLLYDLAERNEALSFSDIKKALGIPTRKTKAGIWRLNLETGGEKRLLGNTTAAQIRKVLGDAAWEALESAKQIALVNDLIAFISADALKKHLRKKWGFTPEIAEQLAELPLESGYHSLSRRAIRRLLPLLERGERLPSAIHQIYGRNREKVGKYEKLPPVVKVFPTLRNPQVIRALTELRKVVNAVISKCGKPTCIRIELARELKLSEKERSEYTKRMRENEAQRKAAAEAVEQKLGRPAQPWEIEKYLLAEECNWLCPYTGKQITFEKLLGENPEFDVEHIWPLRRSLDDSFANKTLCYHEENRSVKAGLIPYEAYSADPVRWNQIIERVKKFKGPLAKKKLQRFLAKEIPDGFVNQQLSDTRWICKAATEYLECLYGGKADENGKQRIFTTTGGMTALLRKAWNLNSILGGAVEKNRADYRQHAIDAIVIALTEPSIIQKFSNQVAKLLRSNDARAKRGYGLLADMLDDEFREEIKQHIEKLIVQFRIKTGLSGQLHDETFYKFVAPKKAIVRKALSAMSQNDVENIVNAKVKKLVKEKLEALDIDDPKKAFALPQNLPYIRGKNNSVFPIKSALVFVNYHVVPIGREPHRRRYVRPNNNHHVEIFAAYDENGKVKGLGRVVTVLEACERRCRGEPVISKDFTCEEQQKGKFSSIEFKFALFKNSLLKCRINGEEKTVRIIAISDNLIDAKEHYDARSTKEVREQGERIRLRYAVVCGVPGNNG